MNKQSPLSKKSLNKQDEVSKLCCELPALQQRLIDAGLVKTAAQINVASRTIGFEAAAIREKHQNDCASQETTQ